MVPERNDRTDRGRGRTSVVADLVGAVLSRAAPQPLKDNMSEQSPEGLEQILTPVERRQLLMASLAQAMHDYVEEAPRESDDFLEGLDLTGDQAKAVFDDLLLYIIGCDDLYMGGEG